MHSSSHPSAHWLPATDRHLALGPRRLALLAVLAMVALALATVAETLPAADEPPTPPAAATAPAVVDNPYLDPETLYLFIIDDSSSMHQNDKLNLRLQAAQLVLALAHDRDQWAVVRFRQGAETRLEPTRVGGVGERFNKVEALQESATSDSPDGTNFVAAFTRAQEVLGKWQGTGRVMAIFLTDGEDINVPNDALSFSVHNLAKQAYQRGAFDFQMKIFGIGNAVSPAQLSLIREDSRGSLVQVANAADLINRVLTLIIQSQNIGRLDPPLPMSFEVGPDVLRIGIIGVGGKCEPGAQPGRIGFLKNVTVRQGDETRDLLTDPNCRLFPPVAEFVHPERYQIAIAEQPPAGIYTIETAGDFQLVDIVIERRLSFLVNPAKPPGRVGEYEPFELSVFMIGAGADLQELARHTRVTADIYGPFAPKSDPSGRALNSNTRISLPVLLKLNTAPGSQRVEFSALVDGLALNPDDPMREGAYTVQFHAVTHENAALTWSRSISARDVLVERLPGRLQLTVTDPEGEFESVDRLSKSAAVKVLSTFQEPLPVLVDFQVARPDQPQPAGLRLPPPLALILPPGHDLALTDLPIQLDEEGNLDLIARVYVPSPEQFTQAAAQIGAPREPATTDADAPPAGNRTAASSRLPMTPEFQTQFLALLPTNQALAAPDAAEALQRLRYAIGASDRKNFSLTLRRPRIVVEPSRVTLDLDRHPIESLWFQKADAQLVPRGIFARLPLAPNTRNPVRPVIRPQEIVLRTTDGSTIQVSFDLPEFVRIGEQPSLRVNVWPQAGTGGAGANAATARLRPGLYTGEADLTLESFDRQPLHQAQNVRLLIRVELTDELAFYRSWLPALLGLALFLLLLSVVVLTRPRFISHQLRPWTEGRPATRVYPLISFARGWWRHRAMLAPEQPGAFVIRLCGLRRLGQPHAELRAAGPLPVFVNETELSGSSLRLRHGDLITVVTAAGSFRYLYFEYIPREEELPRYDGNTAVLPGLFLEDGDFLLVDDEPAPQLLQATVLT